MQAKKPPLSSRLCAILLSLLVVFILLISSIEVVCYYTPNWFENEYNKYHVLNRLNREMTMDSVLGVTDEYMSYLRGDREDLVVYSEIDGMQQEFFTDREKAHMADVRVLFVGALWLRRIAIALIIALLIYMIRKHGKDTAYIVSKHFAGTTAALVAVATGLTALVATNFDKYFVIFHHIFFNNDLWILNPKNDDLINLLPEGFFVDIATRIVIIFIALLVLLIAAAVIYVRKLDANVE